MEEKQQETCANPVTRVATDSDSQLFVGFVFDDRHADPAGLQIRYRAEHIEQAQSELAKISPHLKLIFLPCRLPTINMSVDISCALQFLQRTKYPLFSPKNTDKNNLCMFPLWDNESLPKEFKIPIRGFTLAILASDATSNMIEKEKEESAADNALPLLFSCIPSNVFDNVGAVAFLCMFQSGRGGNEINTRTCNDDDDDPSSSFQPTRTTEDNIFYQNSECRHLLGFLNIRAIRESKWKTYLSSIEEENEEE